MSEINIRRSELLQKAGISSNAMAQHKWLIISCNHCTKNPLLRLHRFQKKKSIID
jgi:hypothetical protein